jgi:hypothetical protein
MSLHAFITLSLDKDGQLHVPADLPIDKGPRCPLDRSLGEPRSRSGRCCEEKYLLRLSKIEPRFVGPQAPSLGTCPTRLL